MRIARRAGADGRASPEAGKPLRLRDATDAIRAGRLLGDEPSPAQRPSGSPSDGPVRKLVAASHDPLRPAPRWANRPDRHRRARCRPGPATRRDHRTLVAASRNPSDPLAMACRGRGEPARHRGRPDNRDQQPIGAIQHDPERGLCRFRRHMHRAAAVQCRAGARTSPRFPAFLLPDDGRDAALRASPRPARSPGRSRRSRTMPGCA